MRSSLILKRSIVIDGRKTSISLEDAFWAGLKNIAHANGMTLAELASKVDSTREHNLSSALRQYVLHHFRNLFLLHKLRSEDEEMDVAKVHLSTGNAETKTALPVSLTSESSSP